MNDEDLRDLFALGAMIGQIMRSGNAHPTHAYETADAMIEARYYEEPEEPEVGIAAVKRKRTTKEK
jgi:hypothetical protein